MALGDEKNTAEVGDRMGTGDFQGFVEGNLVIEEGNLGNLEVVFLECWDFVVAKREEWILWFGQELEESSGD